MARKKRGVLAFNPKTGEKKAFASEYEAARHIGSSITHIQQARLRITTCLGWEIYDTPDGIRERIAELEALIPKVEELEKSIEPEEEA